LLTILLLPYKPVAADQTTHFATDAWRGTGEIRIGYAADIVPFSYERKYVSTTETARSPDNDAGATAPDSGVVPAGYAVELCEQVVSTINGDRHNLEGTGVQNFKPVYVVVDTTTRFKMLREKQIDILCGATTVTLARMKEFDYSLFTFLSGATFMYRVDVPLGKLSDLKGHRIGYLNNSSSVTILKSLLEQANLSVDTLSPNDAKLEKPVPPDVVQLLEVERFSNVIDLFSKKTGNIEAFFGDREILFMLLSNMRPSPTLINRRQLTVSRLSFSLEPYALVFNRDNPLLRYYANRTLVKLFRNGSILDLLKEAFPSHSNSEYLDMLFRVQQIPEG
jgi:polar amino acid transport system substrate-binding protein/glutamate/aspartate transport system substrate-binding protein